MGADRLFRDHKPARPAPRRLIDCVKPAIRREIEVIAAKMGVDAQRMTLAITLSFLREPRAEQLRIVRERPELFGARYSTDEQILRAISKLERQFRQEMRRERNA